MNACPTPQALPAADANRAAAARAEIRSGRHTGHTAGMAPGHVQGNLMVLPHALAEDFLRFCQRNPRSCPLLAVSEPGDPALPLLGAGIDIRHDVPRYRVWRDGVLVDEPTDIAAVWQADMVSFVIGCSFSFEHALLEAGVPLRHVAEQRNVAMYRTSVPTVPAGPFHGPMVVSMRPMSPAHAIRAVQVTSRYPAAHGAPVHIGLPAHIGIADLARPDFGDPVEIRDDELPVFWACGVTPQAVAMAARPPLCITHAPGCMLVTDLLDRDVASF